MQNFARTLALLGLLASLFGLSGCRSGANPYTKELLGGIDTREATARGPQPRQAPRTVYVADFALDAENLQGDQGVRGMLPGQVGGGVVGGLGQRLPHPFASGDPAREARQIVDTMARSLVDALTKKGLPARRIDVQGTPLPASGWLLQGMFTEVDEGNRFKRAVIGFGRGASTMEVQVGISDLASTKPTEPFMIFGTVKDPNKLPGAVVTMNPYVAAAKFVMEKNATGRDINNTAEQIVDEILKYEQTIRQEAESRKRHPGSR